MLNLLITIKDEVVAVSRRLEETKDEVVAVSRRQEEMSRRQEEMSRQQEETKDEVAAVSRRQEEMSRQQEETKAEMKEIKKDMMNGFIALERQVNVTRMQEHHFIRHRVEVLRAVTVAYTIRLWDNFVGMFTMFAVRRRNVTVLAVPSHVMNYTTAWGHSMVTRTNNSEGLYLCPGIDVVIARCGVFFDSTSEGAPQYALSADDIADVSIGDPVAAYGYILKRSGPIEKSWHGYLSRRLADTWSHPFGSGAAITSGEEYIFDAKQDPGMSGSPALNSRGFAGMAIAYYQEHGVPGLDSEAIVVPARLLAQCIDDAADKFQGSCPHITEFKTAPQYEM